MKPIHHAPGHAGRELRSLLREGSHAVDLIRSHRGRPGSWRRSLPGTGFRGLPPSSRWPRPSLSERHAVSAVAAKSCRPCEPRLSHPRNRKCYRGVGHSSPWSAWHVAPPLPARPGSAGWLHGFAADECRLCLPPSTYKQWHPAGWIPPRGSHRGAGCQGSPTADPDRHN